MRIDAHQHFWSLRRGRYDWLTPALGVLYQDRQPEHLRPLLEEHQIAGTILVQASDTVAETRDLLALAQREDFVRGVVGWVPLERPGVGQILRELARDELLVGVRPMLQDLDQDDWILRADVARGLAVVEALGLALDALVHPRHLPHVAQLARERPGLTIVLDHAGKPDVAAGADWVDAHSYREQLRQLARCDNVVVKLSGLVTQARAGWTTSELAPTVRLVLDVFGPARVLWGSDWPVVDLAGGYSRWWDATLTLLESLTSLDREAVLGDNALRCYVRTKDTRADSQRPIAR